MIFEMNPIERAAIASTPASAPNPTAETKIRPHTISCTERESVISPRPNTKLALPSGVMLAAPSQATGSARKSPSRVASVAINTVSIAGSTRSGSSAASK